MNLVPLPPFVTIVRSDPETVSKGGILLPDNAQKQNTRGVVVAVYKDYIANDNVNVTKCKVKEGDIVIFRKYGGDEFAVGSQKVLFVNESDVLGVIS